MSPFKLKYPYTSGQKVLIVSSVSFYCQRVSFGLPFQPLQFYMDMVRADALPFHTGQYPRYLESDPYGKVVRRPKDNGLF